MNLYEIDNAILGCVDAETGEIINEDMLSELELARDTKIENIALWVKNLTAEAEALKAEKLKFEKRQKAAENKAESLKKYLSGYLEGTAFDSTRVRVSFRKSQSVEITDIQLVPDEFLKPVKPEADKTAIKEALKAGIHIDGAELIDNNSIQIK